MSVASGLQVSIVHVIRQYNAKNAAGSPSSKTNNRENIACNKLCLLIGSLFAKLFKTDKERERQP